jgi:hypothetical protein
MRQFASTQFRLRTAPVWLRLVYAGFLCITAVGLLTQAGFQAERLGWAPAQIARYYRGGETVEGMSFPKPLGHLVEVTHAHAFMMAVIFLVLAHLFAASSVSPRLKGVTICAVFAGMLGDLVAPWLIRYAWAGFAWLLIASWIALWAGGLAMIGVSLWECLASTP